MRKMISDSQIREVAVGDVAGKRIVLRVDLNVPLDENGVADGNSLRLSAARATIEKLQDMKARIVVLAHRGDPNGIDLNMSLQPIVRSMMQKMKSGPCLWQSFAPLEEIHARTMSLATSDVLFVENIRFFVGETKNDEEFSRELATLGDVFVNDAFGVCHREHASVVGIAKHLPSFAGPTILKETGALNRVVDNPARPFVAIAGGAKIHTKLSALLALLRGADEVFVGGALAAAFFKAKKMRIGVSQVELDDEKLAEILLKNSSLHLPEDVVVKNSSGETRLSSPDDIRSDEAIVDIGRNAIAAIATSARAAKTVVWNGPVGVIEETESRVGTDAVAHLLAEIGRGPAFVLAGGGETVDVIESLKLSDFYDHVSVGGGAMLEYIGGGKLPGLVALRNVE